MYIVSNRGSFGEGVYKIGMTHRANPMDRVEELNCASVPFPFDVECIIPTEDADGLERWFHEVLSRYRVNKVNGLKEFFKVDSGVLERLVHDLDASVEFGVYKASDEWMASKLLGGNIDG